MGFAENVFQKILKKLSNDLKENDPRHFSLFAHRLELFCALCVKPTFNPKVLLSRKFVGLNGNSLFLPEVYRVLNTEELIYKAYVYLVLQITAAHNLGFYSKQRHSEIYDRIEFLKNMAPVNQYLDQHYPGYRILQTTVLEAAKRLKPAAQKHHALFAFWCANSLSRQPKRIAESPPLKYKINEPIPDFLLITTPCTEIME